MVSIILLILQNKRNKLEDETPIYDEMKIN